MANSESTRVTRLLSAAGDGDRDAAAELLPLVYDELRKLARRRLAKLPPGHTLQATALVHEAYLRVVGQDDPGWDGRAHFFAAAAQAMRNIMVERARRRGRVKHGGGRRQVEFDEKALELNTVGVDILAMDEVLRKLEALDKRKSEIVTLRYFAGMTIEEIASLYAVSARTIEREWRFTRAWLQNELGESPPTPGSSIGGD